MRSKLLFRACEKQALLHSYIARLLKIKQYSNISIYQSNHAFTLIELLIVIALIGILTSFGIYSFQSSQKKARDGQRKSDLAQVKKAMEAAKNDCLAGSYYPYDDISSNVPTTRYTYLVGLHLAVPSLRYLSSNITDPLYTGTSGYALANSSTKTLDVCPDDFVPQGMTYNGTKTFTLFAKLEIANDPDSAKSIAKCFIASEWTAIYQTTYNPQGVSYYVCND